MDLNQFKKDFISEAEALLTNLDNLLLELEKEPGSKHHVNEVFRVMHTIKGASGMYGFEKVVEITHELESLYDLIREDKLKVNKELIELTFLTADHIRSLLADENVQDSKNLEQHSVILKYVEQVKKQIDGYEEAVSSKYAGESVQNIQLSGSATWNILFYPNDQIIKRAINLIYTFHDLFQLGDYKIEHQPFGAKNKKYWSIFLFTEKPYDEIESALLFVMEYCKIVRVADFNIFEQAGFENRELMLKESENSEQSAEQITQQVLPNMSQYKEKNTSYNPKNITTHINVDATKLDSLMYLVSELVTTKSELILALQKQNYEKATDAAEKIEKLTKGFSENAMNIRLVSLKEMLSKFKRHIRDLASQLDKKIDFVISGEDTELDKNIVDSIAEPIMHIIRNCIDHGIEIPAKRTERNKPEIGTLSFEAKNVGNYVYITIGDDGNGIDTDYIYKKAVEKGFVPAGIELSQNEILKLIFLPGFSTAQNLSNVSGRGVGMDIVLSKMRETRGEIMVDSIKGEGTTFTLKLQQTISIVETLLVTANNQTFAIPLEDIEVCELTSFENTYSQRSGLVIYNKELIPSLHIRKQLCAAAALDLNQTERIVIVNKQNRRFALIVDNIIGEFQAVVKPIGKAFTDVKFLSGASLLGDGSIALLLDTDKLWYEISNKQKIA